MTGKVLALTLIFTTSLSLAGHVLADVLLIEEVRQSERMNLPENGSSMEDVRASKGEPVKTHAAIGDPPITRWDYDSWSVYFEYKTVLFTVLEKGVVIDKKGSQ